MGFPEDQATAALRAAMGNPDVAVEFLMTGIPDNVQVQIVVLRTERCTNNFHQRRKLKIGFTRWPSHSLVPLPIEMQPAR